MCVCGGGGGEGGGGFREVNLAGNACKWHRITKASVCIIQRNVHQQIIKIYYTKNVFMSIPDDDYTSRNIEINNFEKRLAQQFS